MNALSKPNLPTPLISAPLLAFLLIAGCSNPPPTPSGAETTSRSSAPKHTPKTALSRAFDHPAAIPAADMARRAPTFQKYWYQGLAELSRYRLTQQRYGQAHEGELVLIFVTEPFLRGRQVKHEHGPGEDVSVLKLHSHRHFFTGVYPYNILTTAFVPAQGDEGALKVAFTTTEWCGVVYAQLNRLASGWRVRSHSYFQAEGDEDTTAPEAIVEDGLLSRLRRDPASLPVGELPAVIPGLTYLRLLHKPIRPTRAIARREPPAPRQGVQLASYVIEYPELRRTLTVRYAPAFPHTIHAIEETAPDLTGAVVTTTARLDRSVMLDYWARHGASD